MYHDKDQAFTIWKVANVIMIYLKGIGFLYKELKKDYLLISLIIIEYINISFWKNK